MGENHSESDSNEAQEQQNGTEPMSERDMEVELFTRSFPLYTNDGNFSVYFKLVHNREEALEDIKENTFYPDFVHQFFVNSERIFGYKKPIIRFFYSASRLKRYFKFDYEDKITKDKDGIEPDDVVQLLAPVLEDQEHTSNLDQFMKDLESEDERNFRPPGELLHEFEGTYKKPKLLSRAQIEQLEMAGITNGSSKPTNGVSKALNGSSNGDGPGPSAGPSYANTNEVQTSCKKRYQIFHANANTEGFRHFQARMQTLIMWFIESATMIDFEDTHWDFFMIFEKFNPSTSDESVPAATAISSEDRFYFAGYATVYRYYAYPDKTRPRVSQMLLLPPYRRNGLGTVLLQSIYDYYVRQPSTLDITAEDPDEEFISMRDFLDCKNCSGLDSFQPDKLRQGWSIDMAKEAQKKLGLCQRQARKVYEILKLRIVDTEDEEQYKKYRLEIKNRLNVPNQRMKLACNKVEKLGGDIPEALRIKRDNQKLTVATLDENYHELERQYRHTIDKLNKT